MSIPDEGTAFGKWLSGLREAAGLTQADLAQAAGVSMRTVQRWEGGQHAPVDTVRVLTALGVKIDPPAPDSVRALNIEVGRVTEMLSQVDDWITDLKGADAAGEAAAAAAPAIGRRLRELEATVDRQGEAMMKSLESVAGHLARIEARLAAQDPPANSIGGAAR